MARVVQLSDLHLTSRAGERTRGVDPLENLRGVLARVGRPDLVVLTGDLAAHPSASAYALLREAVGERPVRVIPGNHDDRDLLRAAFGLPAPRRTVGFVERIGGWRLIGLDTLTPGKTCGTLGVDQIDWLAGELATGSEPVLLFMHHPPMPIGTWWLDRDVVREAAQLGEVVARSGRVRGIFCGHVHQEKRGRLGEVDVMTTPSTSYQFLAGSLLPARVGAERPGWRVIELGDGKFETRVERN